MGGGLNQWGGGFKSVGGGGVKSLGGLTEKIRNL